MALRLEDKKQVVTEVGEVAQSALSAVAAEYRGLSVAEMTELRKQARQAEVHLRVVRNTLARRAFEGTEFACMQESLKGPLMLAFAQSEPGSAARLFRDFSKEHESLKVCVLSIGGKLLDVKELETLAKLPTRDEARTQLLRVMKASVTQLVRTLAEPHTCMVRVLAAVRDQKQS